MAVRLAAARARLAGVAHVTPVVRSRQLDERTGAQVFLKCENLQRVGAFKFRGAWNAITALEPAVRARGVVAYSSGNHAQAVACAAQRHGVPCHIVMPSSAPRPKLAATRDYGATIHHHDLMGETREGLAERLAHEHGATLIPPFDHPDVVAGQGTAAAELLESHGPFDLLVACLGGGGLLSGTAVAAAVDGRGARVVGAEPAAGDDGARSFRSGRLETVHEPDTICDGARTPSLSALTLALIRRHAHDVVTVTDAEVLEALGFLWERVKLVVEPTGALGVAALLHRGIARPGERVGVILSGGNVDLSSALRAFERPARG
ncbi:MAG: L-threo-3-hydroxyaspartate ammonia-lyase [Candidatus Eisenbacteria bacterium]